MSTSPLALGSGVALGLVEDSQEDFEAFSRVVARDAPEASVQRWPNAEAVLDALTSPGAGREAWPTVLVVDLNLPGIDGCELVRRLRSIPATQTMPLFVLSGSDLQRDIDRCYAAGANAYLTKPASAAELRALLQMVLRSLAVYKAPTPPSADDDEAWQAIQTNREDYERELREERLARGRSEELRRLTSRLANRITRAELVKSLADELGSSGAATAVTLLEPTEHTPPQAPLFSDGTGREPSVAFLPLQSLRGGTRRTLRIETARELDDDARSYLVEVGAIVGSALDRIARLASLRRAQGASSDLPNERWWWGTLAEAIRTATTQREPISIVCVELVDFARYLVTNGHVAGDQRLLTVTEGWRRAGIDLFSPYGDEQFVAILPSTSAARAGEIVQSITRSPGMAGLFVTGIAQWNHGETERQLMLRAEEALAHSVAAG